MFASLKHKFKIWPRSKHTQSRITKTCTGIKKTNKPIDAPNLHKHQKKQTTRCIKPAKAPKKIKNKIKFPGTMGPLLSSCWVFCFLCFFGACQCFVKSESPNLHRHQKKQKKQTTRCTKPAQAPKKTKKLKFPGTMGPLLSSCWNFCFFGFFGACRCLVHLVVWFFWCLSMFLYISCQDHDEKSVFY